ncbi:hypothetical protein [uncultured Brachyspira sp.]|uniref:hypothetical protein n=1 Tax=uncultured Brachyspira sp. TaxID=221953 RepID=UPI0025DFB74F|nr:hypothetical protein [uncultured Brachyspira sp.]
MIFLKKFYTKNPYIRKYTILYKKVKINKDLSNQFDPKDNNNKDLDTIAEREEKKQNINEKKFIFCVKISGIIVCSLFLIAVFIIYMLHLILP